MIDPSRVLWQQLRRFAAAAALSAMIMGVLLVCVWAVLRFGNGHAQAYRNATLIMTTGYMLTIALMVVIRVRQHDYATFLALLFLLPPIFLLNVFVEGQRIPYFGWWLWGLAFLSIWALLNIPREREQNPMFFHSSDSKD